MTKILYAVIDNCSGRKKTNYKIIFKARSFAELEKFLDEKGLKEKEDKK